MSDDLIKLGEDCGQQLAGQVIKHNNRIEQLERDLAKALGALREIAGSVPYADNPWHIALAALAELEGK